MTVRSPQHLLRPQLSGLSLAEIEKNDNSKNALEEHPQRVARISFNEKVSVKETIHVSDYTDEELYRTWYKKEDFTRMKTSFSYTVQLMASGKYPGDSDEMTSRGLEYRYREGALRRKANKLNALYAVLDEQERQRNRGTGTDEDLREAYLRNSEFCRDAARAMGMQDEQECRRINSVPELVQTSDEEEDDLMSVTSDKEEDEDDMMTEVKPHRVTMNSGFARLFRK